MRLGSGLKRPLGPLVLIDAFSFLCYYGSKAFSQIVCVVEKKTSIFQKGKKKEIHPYISC